MTGLKPRVRRAAGSLILPWGVTALTLAIFGGALALVTLHLRENLRHEMTTRDGEALYSVALAHQYDEGLLTDLFGSVEDPANQFELVLKTSRIRGVIAARLFNSRGQFLDAFPPTVAETKLSDPELDSLAKLVPASKYLPAGNVSDVFLRPAHAGELANRTMPLLQVNIPLHPKEQNRLVGIAQFILDGQGLAQRFSALDRHLFWQAGILFVVGGSFILLALPYAFHRLQRANQLLQQRSSELSRVNQELVLAAKTSALGAVTAHLIHGLRNPLFGLTNLVNQRAQEKDLDFDTEWRTAAMTTQRMHALVNEVVRVLQDDQDLVDSQISLGDLAEILQSRCSRLALEAGVRFTVSAQPEAFLAHRAANLTLLILQNLIQNAIEATATGKQVKLSLFPTDDGVVCEVRDEGSGIPSQLREVLFTSCRSTKPSNSGIGLAISKQLANHMGAALELRDSSPAGTTFQLRLPAETLAGQPSSVAA